MPAPSALRLRTAAVTVLLGAAEDRGRVLRELDEDAVRCAGAHDVPGRRLDLTGAPTDGRVRAERLHERAGDALLLVARPTAGLDTAGRRTVLGALQALARTGTAVLVDDEDPLAVLAVADAALRVAADGTLREDDLALVS